MNYQITTGAAFILTVKNRYYLCGGEKKNGVIQPRLQITCKTETCVCFNVGTVIAAQLHNSASQLNESGYLLQN